ncbi:hypothetical protein [Caballeronia sp. DA-9]|uniref:hypothetical protein n=1 Tax=Caballeronia sp. DA-9 TaxID=3436237 RepID=UPI003F67DAE7
MGELAQGFDVHRSQRRGDTQARSLCILLRRTPMKQWLTISHVYVSSGMSRALFNVREDAKVTRISFFFAAALYD